MGESLAVHCRSRWPDRPEREVRGEINQSLFDMLKAGGQPVASSCTAEAVCGKCIVRIVDGADQLSPTTDEERTVLEREGASVDERLACRAQLLGEGVVLSASYW